MIAPIVTLKCAEKKNLKFMVVEKENSGKQEIIFRAGTSLSVCLPGNGRHQGRWVYLDQGTETVCPREPGGTCECSGLRWMVLGQLGSPRPPA